MSNGNNEKPTMPSTIHIRNLLSKEIDNEPVAFAWPHITEECRRMDYIFLGDDAENVYAVSIYQNKLPDSVPEGVRDEMKTASHDGTNFFYTEVGKKTGNYKLQYACEYLTTTNQTTDNMRREYHERISVSDATETERIELEKLRDLISQGTVLFYTGAGASISAGLPSGDTIKSELGVQMNREFDAFTESLALRADQFQDKLYEYQRLFYGGTSKAHEALERLRANNPDRIILATENLDKLHQNAGSPVITFGQISEVPEEFLQEVDCIVTIGLQQACTNLLQRYKETNGAGKLAALNINPPPYQYPADYYIEGDAQEILSKVAE